MNEIQAKEAIIDAANVFVSAILEVLETATLPELAGWRPDKEPPRSDAEFRIAPPDTQPEDDCPACYDAMFREFGGGIRTQLKRLNRCPEHLPDLTQHVSLCLIEADVLGKFRRSGRGSGFRSYLRVAVNNHFKNWCRTRSRRYQEILLPPGEDGQAWEARLASCVPL